VLDTLGVFLYTDTIMNKKQIKKLYLKGYKHSKGNRPTQNEYDLMMVKKIKDYSKDGVIDVSVTSEYFYDSYDYNVTGYDEENIYTIPAFYTAYRHFYNYIMSGADSPTYVKIVEE
jgi:hypothetical protein